MKAENILKELNRIMGNGVVMTTAQAQSLYQLIPQGWYGAAVADRNETMFFGFIRLSRRGMNRCNRYIKCVFIFPNGDYQCEVFWVSHNQS